MTKKNLSFGEAGHTIMAMYVKSIIFVAILCLSAGHACAGLMCAEWTGLGSGAYSVADIESDPSESPNPAAVGWLTGGDAGMAAVVITSAGGSAFSAATLLFPPALPAPSLVLRLALKDDVVPPSPVLDGLIKPA